MINGSGSTLATTGSTGSNVSHDFMIKKLTMGSWVSRAAILSPVFR